MYTMFLHPMIWRQAVANQLLILLSIISITTNYVFVVGLNFLSVVQVNELKCNIIGNFIINHVISIRNIGLISLASLILTVG